MENYLIKSTTLEKLRGLPLASATLKIAYATQKKKAISMSVSRRLFLSCIIVRETYHRHLLICREMPETKINQAIQYSFIVTGNKSSAH